MCCSVPISVFILDSATNPVAVVSKTSVNCIRMELIAERSEAR